MLNEKNKTIKMPVTYFLKCRKCNKCIETCPNNAIIMSFNNCCPKCVEYYSIMDVPCQAQEIIFQYDNCDKCSKCLDNCPESAVFWLEDK